MNNNKKNGRGILCDKSTSEDDNTIYIIGIGFQALFWIQLAHESSQWRDLVNYFCSTKRI
jgi:hypothetical protein